MASAILRRGKYSNSNLSDLSDAPDLNEPLVPKRATHRTDSESESWNTLGEEAGNASMSEKEIEKTLSVALLVTSGIASSVWLVWFSSTKFFVSYALIFFGRLLSRFQQLSVCRPPSSLWWGVFVSVSFGIELHHMILCCTWWTNKLTFVGHLHL